MKLKELVKLAIERQAAMTKEEQVAERKAQRISFAYGNVAMHNPTITKAMVEEAARRMEGE